MVQAMSIIGEILIVVLFATFIVWSIHKLKVRDTRRKKDMCCGHYTLKKYQMIHIEGNEYKCYKFTICNSCKKVQHKPSENDQHRFSKWKLAYRHLRYPEQFILDEELFSQTGLIGIAIPSLSQRIEIFRNSVREAEKRHACRIEQFKAMAPTRNLPTFGR